MLQLCLRVHRESSRRPSGKGDSFRLGCRTSHMENTAVLSVPSRRRVCGQAVRGRVLFLLLPSSKCRVEGAGVCVDGRLPSGRMCQQVHHQRGCNREQVCAPGPVYGRGILRRLPLACRNCLESSLNPSVLWTPPPLGHRALPSPLCCPQFGCCCGSVCMHIQPVNANARPAGCHLHVHLQCFAYTVSVCRCGVVYNCKIRCATVCPGPSDLDSHCHCSICSSV